MPWHDHARASKLSVLRKAAHLKCAQALRNVAAGQHVQLSVEEREQRLAAGVLRRKERKRLLKRSVRC